MADPITSKGADAAKIHAAIRTERRGRIEVWRMHLPKKLNCLNAAMLLRMRELFAATAGDAAVDAVVLTGSGRYFSSGAAFNDVGLAPMLPSSLHAAVARGGSGGSHPLVSIPCRTKPAVAVALAPELCDRATPPPCAMFRFRPP